MFNISFAKVILILILLGLQSCMDCNDCSKKQNEQSTLSVWYVEPTQGSQDAIRDIANQLEREHPGVKVLTKLVPWNTLGTELAIAIAENRSPDVAMVEPYMMASLVSQNMLYPLDDLYAEIGEDDIYPFLREINRFDGKYYGISHAFGVGYFAIRKDYMNKLGLEMPTTWGNLAQLLPRLKEFHSTPVQLPGGTSFLLDQLFISLVASNGGRLFDHANNKPQLNSLEVVQALEFFDLLASFSPEQWRTTTYQETFVSFARGSSALVPVTAARTLNQIASDAPEDIANNEHFSYFNTPMGPNGTSGFNFLDAEPWVVFSSSDNKGLAYEFLKKFYEDENYLNFCNTVPIHLSPAKSSLSKRYAESSFISNWKDWYDFQVKLIQEKKALPMLSSSVHDQQLPFLWEVFQSRIITKMLAESGDPKARTDKAQAEMENLLDTLGFRNW